MQPEVSAGAGNTRMVALRDRARETGGHISPLTFQLTRTGHEST